ncbi:MAG: sugar phosphate nucleotidyltransferase [Sarcina sp.]
MDINNLLIDENTIIIDAISKLDRWGKKFVVVTNEKKLIGVITDGDIRRWILKNGNLSGKAKEIMNKNPKFLFEKDKDKAFKEMEKFKIYAIPIVNKEKEIKEIVFLEDKKVIEENNIPVVIMAGGKGERLKPYTSIIPKMLVPIGEIPIIERIINNFKKFNYKKFYLSINYKKDIIKAYFNREIDYEISYIEESKPLGTIGSLYMLKDSLKEAFFLTNCDILVEANYSDIYNFHKKNGSKITIVTALKNYAIPYGVFTLSEKGNIESLEEKPIYQYLVNVGMYVISPEVLNDLEENNYCDITTLIYKYIEEEKESIKIYPVTENSWLDMGEFDSMKNMLDKLGYK